MRKLTKLNTFTAAAMIITAAGLILYIPPNLNRISWRAETTWTYLRTLVNPIRTVPTALPAPEVVSLGQPTPLSEATFAPTLEPTKEHTATPTIPPTPLPARALLPAPAWEKQDINNCGPAALAMYLRFYGWEGDQKTITEVVKPFRNDRNVNVEELAYFVRTHAGWLQIHYRVGGDLKLLKAWLAAGIPVMIEESFFFDEPYWSGDDLWAAHYQLVTGYDNSTQTFTGQDSFHGADQQVPYQTLDEYWQAFNRVYILIFPPDKEAAVREILGSNWDADANRQHALETAEQETRTNPENPYAWFNLGTNLAYFERYIEATDAYDKARELGLPQRVLRSSLDLSSPIFIPGRSMTCSP